MYIAGEQQQREIATIKPRTITLNLSDADCERIAKEAGKAGLTVSELLQNFIGDLVCGTYSNGSDERDLASQWYERCGFGMFPDTTLIRYLIEEWQEDTFIEDLEEMQSMKDDISYYEGIENPDSDDLTDLECAKEVLAEAESRIDETYSDYVKWCREEKPQSKEDAISGVLAWRDELAKLKGDDAD